MTELEARAVITSRLQPGERLLWSDSPRPWKAVQNGPLLRLLFGTFFLAFALFWTWGASSASSKNGSPLAQIFPFFELIFIGFALYQLWSALQAIIACRETAYGLTDRRVIIAIGKDGSTQSLGPGSLGRIERSGDSERGTLKFDLGGPSDWWYTRSWMWKPQPAFVDIRDPAKVEAAIYTHLLSHR